MNTETADTPATDGQIAARLRQELGKLASVSPGYAHSFNVEMWERDNKYDGIRWGGSTHGKVDGCETATDKATAGEVIEHLDTMGNDAAGRARNLRARAQDMLAEADKLEATA